MDFEKICMVFAMQEPYYGIILSSMLRQPDPKIPTIAVGRSGNVFRLKYNPDFVKDLSVDETLVVLKHEVLHLMLNHFTLWETDNLPDWQLFLRNAAEDMAVNCYIDVDKVKRLKPCLASDYGWESNLGAREYFRRIMEQVENNQQKYFPQQQQQSQEQGETTNQDSDPDVSTTESGQSDSDQQQQQGQNDNSSESAPEANNGQGLSSGVPDAIKQEFHTIDDHSEWPDDTDESMKEDVQNMIDSLTVFAAEETEKACGTIPAEMVGRVEQLRKKPKPVADWRRYCRRYLGNEFSEIIRRSKKRLSRRFEGQAGIRHARKSNILVAIDTSGSVSMPELQEFFGQIRTMRDSACFHVIEADAEIAFEYEYRGKLSTELHGGGGTDFSPVIDYYIKNKKKYDALVYFTDGEAFIPKNTPKDTLWVISSKGNHERNRYLVNGAHCVIIPPHK